MSDMPPDAPSASTPRFSIVILCRNEERYLPRVLFDLGEFIDSDGEVVLVDTGSTDDSVVIARRRGCRVEVVGDRFDTILSPEKAAEMQRRFGKAGEQLQLKPGQRMFNFAAARQFAGERASNDFILQLDASDEILALEIDAFDDWINEGGIGTFEYAQRYGDVNLRIARFYDRRRYHWEGRVHEVLFPTAGADPAPVSRFRCEPMELEVRHRADMGKERNYLAGLALQVLDHPEKPRWWHFLGRELFYDRCFHSALATLEVHCQFENAWAAERSQSLCFMGECFEALGRVSEARQSYSRAFSADSTRREPLLREALICSRLCEFDTAAHLARQALDVPLINPYPEPEANYTWLPHSLLYWSLFWLGRKDEARVHWDAYRSQVPGRLIMKEHARLFPTAKVPDSAPASSPAVDKVKVPAAVQPPRLLKVSDPPV